MDRARALLAQRRQRRRERRCALRRRQRLRVGHRAERVALLVLGRGCLRDRHQTLGQQDLAIERRRADRGADDVGGQRTPRRFELATAHVDARGAGRTRIARRAEQVERVVRLQLSDEYVVTQALRPGAGDVRGARARNLRVRVERRQRRRADLRAQFLLCGGERFLRRGQCRIRAQAFVDQRVERAGAIQAPPLRNGRGADVELLRDTLRSHRLPHLRLCAVMRGRRHGGRRAARGQRAAAQAQRGSRGQRRSDTREFHQHVSVDAMSVARDSRSSARTLKQVA
ncbi:hypothetical protein FEP70_05879 [Burkholderia multivorans]|nr:hypothetical protein [Burkholderia multivorans]